MLVANNKLMGPPQDVTDPALASALSEIGALKTVADFEKVTARKLSSDELRQLEQGRVERTVRLENQNRLLVSIRDKLDSPLGQKWLPRGELRQVKLVDAASIQIKQLLENMVDNYIQTEASRSDRQIRDLHIFLGIENPTKQDLLSIADILDVPYSKFRLRFSKNARLQLIEAAKTAAIEKIQSSNEENKRRSGADKDKAHQDNISMVQRELFEMVSPARVQFDKAMHETLEKIKIGISFDDIVMMVDHFDKSENEAIAFLLECISHHPSGTVVSLLTRGDISIEDALWYMRRTEEQPLPVSATSLALRFIEDHQRVIIESLPEASLRGLDIRSEDLTLAEAGLDHTLEIEAILGKAASNKQGLTNILMHKIIEQQELFLKSAGRLNLEKPGLSN